MKVYIQLWKTIFAFLLFSLTDKKLVLEDMEMYLKWDAWKDKSTWQRFAYCMICLPSFRNVFYYRVQNHSILKGLSKLLLRPILSIEIGGDIKGGLYIPHHFATIFPKSAGKNLHVKPGVVIGQISGGKYPVFGDNVMIGANATVIGDIKIGNNVQIGAGTVVNRDIPDDCTVIGNPCRIISRK